MTEFLTCNIISSTTPSSSQNDDDDGGSSGSGNHHHHHPKTREPIEVKDDDDWNDLVDPELKHVLRSVSLPQYNKIWWQHVLNGIMHIPYPVPSHIETRRLDGIIEDGDDDDGKKRNAGRLFWNKNSNSNNNEASAAAATSAIMWIHGGGRIVGSATGANDIMICTKLVELFDDVPVLSVNYRTSLTAPFPAALNDVTDSYKSFVEYLLLKQQQQQQQKTILGRTESEQQQLKIIVAGESAGGGLAAELCQRLLDESTSSSSSSSTLPLPVAQLLIYPMLDDRTGINNINNNDDDDSKQQQQQQKSQKPPNLVWSGENNQYAWDRYLGRQQKEKKNDDDNDDNNDTPPQPQPEPPKYAAAARRTNLVGLPPAWIMVGSLDLFREECYDYAYRLAHDGHVTSRYVEVVGGFHAMFGMGRDTDLVGRSWQDMYDFGSQYI